MNSGPRAALEGATREAQAVGQDVPDALADVCSELPVCDRPERVGRKVRSQEPVMPLIIPTHATHIHIMSH